VIVTSSRDFFGKFYDQIFNVHLKYFTKFTAGNAYMTLERLGVEITAKYIVKIQGGISSKKTRGRLYSGMAFWGCENFYYCMLILDFVWAHLFA
jgi:hypothetical protein